MVRFGSTFRGFATTTAALVLAFGASTGNAQLRLGDILNVWGKSDYAEYPTEFSKGIIPKKIHSHNDYWRDVPLFTAISYGAISIEADVWLVNDTLYVGHDLSSLTYNRTFENLYIKPLFDILKMQNPVTPFVPAGKTRNGVFDSSPSQTLYLFIDLKSPSSGFPAIVRALEPLRAKGWLTTTTSDDTIIPGPITIIGTGLTSLSSVLAYTNRDFFFDAPLLEIAALNITRAIAPVVSASFREAVGEVVGEGLTDAQRGALKSQVKSAHERGLGVRYWDLPTWPVSVRNKIWKEVVEAGVDLLMVDDLPAAALGKW